MLASTEPFRLDGRLALVTGAGRERGIGRAVARMLGAAGAIVIANDATADLAESTAEALRGDGIEALGVAADVSSASQVDEMVRTVLDRYGRIDILVNNAGVTQAIRCLEMSEEDWDRVLDVNLKGTFLCSRAVLPGMIERRYGRIICISSVSGKKGGGRIGGVHYAASKAGILGFARALVREVSPHGVTVNAICPGTIDTGKAALQRQWDGTPAEEGLRQALAGIPSGRLGQPEDVAAAVLFFASDAAAWVTGEVMDVNGGAYID